MKKTKILLIFLGLFIALIAIFVAFPSQHNLLMHKLYKFTNNTINREVIIPIKYLEKNQDVNKVSRIKLYNTNIFCEKITNTQSEFIEKVDVYIKFEYNVNPFGGTFISLQSVNENTNYREIELYPLKFKITNKNGEIVQYIQYGIDNNTNFVITFDKKVFSQENNELYIKFTNLNLISYRMKNLKEIIRIKP